MKIQVKRFQAWAWVLLFLMITEIFIDLFSGAYPLTFIDLYKSLFSFEIGETTQLVMREFRIPRVFTALLAGAALSASGLLMQTLFNNPLAGPYVLGISSGSSLFVALGSLTGFGFFLRDEGMVVLAFVGAVLFGLIILFCSLKIRSQVSLLLIGLMLGSIAGAFITMFEATASAQELRAYTMWTMGSLQQTQFEQLPLFFGLVFAAMLLSLFLIKPLNALVLGEEHAALLGISIRRFRLLTIVLTAVMSGTVTAYCGPIAFVGLAVPNMVRLLFRTVAHDKLLVGCILMGGCFVLASDIIIQLLEGYFILPLNALTSIIGAPIIIGLIFRRLV